MEILGVTYNTAKGKTFLRHKPQVFAAYASVNDIQAVRLPVSYKNQRHLPGYFWMSRTGSLVAYESRLEMAVLLQLDFNPTVTRVVSQPFVLHYESQGVIYRHTPDFLVYYNNGAVEIIDVKPRRFVRVERNVRAFKACAQAVTQMGWAYGVRSEINPVLLRNLQWLSGFRRAPASLQEYGPLIVSVTKKPVSIAAVIQQVDGNPLLVRPVLFYLLWTSILKIDLAARMTDCALVYAARKARHA
jgi:hypothetical protein